MQCSSPKETALLLKCDPPATSLSPNSLSLLSLPEMADDGSASVSPTGSASGSPSPPPSPSPVPSYPELIRSAIAVTGGTVGCTKAAISAHIETSLSSSLLEDHASLLSSHLANMSASGELTFNDDLYSLTPVKRGRGRPPKPRLPGDPGPRRSSSDGPRRPRGRPPKPRDPSATEKVPRPRGRPPKTTNGGSAEPTGEKKQRGRPPKVRAQIAEVGFV